jgi:hypothetical protein
MTRISRPTDRRPRFLNLAPTFNLRQCPINKCDPQMGTHAYRGSLQWKCMSSHVVYAASRISCNVNGGTKQFGRIQAIGAGHGVNANQVFSWRRQYLQGLLNQVIEINDVLNKRNLWRHEYPTIGAGSKTREEGDRRRQPVD